MTVTCDENLSIDVHAQIYNVYIKKKKTPSSTKFIMIMSEHSALLIVMK